MLSQGLLLPIVGVQGRRIGLDESIQGRIDVILLTRLNGAAFAVNPDLVERAESTPDTVVTLVDGTKYVVQEPVEEIIERVRDFRASVVARSYLLERELAGDPAPPHLAPAPSPDSAATVVPLHQRWEG